MKIDPMSADVLLERMRAAHSESAAASSPAESAGFPEIEASESARLEQSVRACAERALRGEFGSADEIRGVVVEEIVQDRWSEHVGESKLGELTDALKESLVDDPEFARQVDEMLILAASRLVSR